jgi:hypothetical protein
MRTKYLFSLISLLFVCQQALAETYYQPFVLASLNETGLEKQTQTTIDALVSAGFTVAGQYSPVEGANVLVVTSPELLAAAAVSEKGGYGAGERVSVTERDGQTEVAFINPLYIQYAYRMEADLQPVYDALAAALGNLEPYGADKKMSAKQLDKYHYMMAMPYFDDVMELGTFDSHEAAVEAVENGLAVEGDALTQVYRIDIPGKDQTVFGVGMKATGADEDEIYIDDTHQLAIVDFEGPGKAAYFPYEILVDGNEVEALHMRFRMAVHFPDLAMTGDHGFMKLRKSPPAVEDAFENMVSPE